MKKIGGLILILFIFVRCSNDFLNLTSPNAISQEIFWQTEKDVKLALTGCYSVLQDNHMYNSVSSGNSGYPGLDFATDNGYMTWNYKSGGAIGNGIHTASDNGINGMWNMSYAGIARSNYLLDNISKVKELSEEDRNRYMAEAKFLRALHYNNLILLYRDVPFISTHLVLEEANVAKSSKSVILDFIVQDLKSSVEYLPLPKDLPDSEWGRATRGAGYALLGHIFLNNHLYQEAAEYTKKVIDLKFYELHPDYDQLFTSAHEQNNEIIFPVCYKRGLNGEGSGFGWFTGSRVPDNHHPLKNLADEFYMIDGKPITESSLYNPNLEMENRDPRFNVTLISRGSMWHDKVVADGQLALTGYALRKWVEENTANRTLNQNDSDQDFYIFRLGHIILDRAEALVQAGGYDISEVINLVNMIRRRVGMPLVEDVEGADLSKNELMEIIMHERRVETAFEGRRYFDLKRWGKLKERAVDYYNINERGKNSKLQIRLFEEPKHNVWPIPQSELDRNPMLEQHQEWQ